MIKSVSVRNFRSIKDQITLDFSKSNRKKGDLSNYISISNTEIATTTVIYGANASGKSNLLRAFKALEYLVLNSAKFDSEDKLGPYEPLRLAKGLDKKPVSIDIEIFIDQIRYIYLTDSAEKFIIHEKLHFFPIGKE